MFMRVPYEGIHIILRFERTNKKTGRGSKDAPGEFDPKMLGGYLLDQLG